MISKWLNTDAFMAKEGLDRMTHKADRFMLYMLWAHLPIASFLAPYSYGTWKEGLIASLFINIIGTISYFISRGTFAHRLLNGLLLLSYSVILISVQYGRIEMHFHVFASLPFLILYRDWRIIPPAALLIAVHHAAFNYCQSNNIEFLGFPLIAFNYGSGWDIVILHAIFVVFESSVLIYYSELLKKQYLDVSNTNKNLESIVGKRTKSLRREKEKIGAYKKSLDQVAITALTDSKGTILDVNKNFELISEYTRSELIGQNHRIINSSHHPKDFFESMWKKIKSGEVWRGEIKNKSKSGRTYWVETAIAPLKNSEGEINKYMAIRFDITNRKEQEETILRQQEQIVAQAKLSSLGEMAGGIAHEINNPLAVISSTMKTIRKMITKNMIGTDDFNEALDDIDDTVVRITKIVSGLRNVSRDTNDDSFDTCKISDVINDVLPLCSEKLKNHEVDLEVNMSKKMEEVDIHVMRVPLSQVLLNLITNAYDEITYKDYKHKWIRIEVISEGNEFTLKIIDSGNGIPIDIQEKMFQPFFTTKDVGKGTGLGLSLSHSIIKRHGGDFYIDNEYPNTCFVIKLPIIQESKLSRAI
jgi:PAS domain S-box-containing protein